MKEYLHIGRVANAHGVKGFLKILVTTDDQSRFELLDEVILELPDGKKKKYGIQQVKYLNQFVLLKLEGVKNMDDAVMLKRSIVMIDRKDALPLGEDENYICDLVGMEVFDQESGDKLGELKDVMLTGANDVYVIDDGSKYGIMLPAMKQWVHEVDVKNKRMVVSLPEGLVD